MYAVRLVFPDVFTTWLPQVRHLEVTVDRLDQCAFLEQLPNRRLPSVPRPFGPPL
jgi:hypothetical protein